MLSLVQVERQPLFKGGFNMYLTTGQVARLLCVSQVTLARWDRAGRLVPDARDSNGNRLYLQATLESYQRAVQCQKGGVAV